MKEKDGRDSLSREHMMERRGEEFGKKNPRQMAAHLPSSPGSMDNPYGRNSHLGNRVLAALELLTCGRSWANIEPKQQAFLRSGHQAAKNSEKHQLLISGSPH